MPIFGPRRRDSELEKSVGFWKAELEKAIQEKNIYLDKYAAASLARCLGLPKSIGFLLRHDGACAVRLPQRDLQGRAVSPSAGIHQFKTTGPSI